MIAKSAEETKKFAKDLLKNLAIKHILALYGDLGSGKTTFVQGLAEGLGIKKRVLSPTFVFQRSYELNKGSLKKFHHIDLYRLSTLKDAKAIGVDETLAEKDSLIAIEWPEVIENTLPKETVRIRFKKINGGEREITVENP